MRFPIPIASSNYRYAFALIAVVLALSPPPSASAQTVTSVLTYPKNLAANVDLLQPIQWTSVDKVQDYYLYVGSTPGAKDLVNSGSTLQTSWLAVNLPPGQTLYVRLWTCVADVWRYADSTFVAAPVLKATITYPASGAVNADLTRPIQWTSVPSVQAYYLYVGSAPGGKDLVSTGEIQKTSYLPPNLPHSQTLYSRIYTKVGGGWRYVDGTFSVAPRARLTYPADGAVNVDASKPIQWTSIANVQAYYLYVGSTAGGRDLVNSGETLQTSYAAANLPASRTLYARVWTKAGGVWRYADSTFTTEAPPPPIATLAYPANGAVNIDQTQPAAWAQVTGAQAYYLKIGSTVGAKDILDSYETQLTQFPILGIPAGQTLFADLCTKSGGTWRCSDSTFTASPLAPRLTYPTDGMVAVDPSRVFQWTPPANSVSHQLKVGTTPGANNVFDSGEIAGTSAVVANLPRSSAVYARVLSKVNGIWRHTDIAFTLESSSPIAHMTTPATGALVDTQLPFTWESVPLARAYRLTIGTTVGGSDLHDSGEIHVTRRFVPNLHLGPLCGRLQTKINGTWYASDFTFTVLANTVSADRQVESALWATDLVRSMALSDNRPFTWTELARQLPARRYQVMCYDYAETLLRVLAGMNSQLSSRRLDIALNPNNYDAHTLVEMYEPNSQRWMLLDPTFDLSVKRTSDGQWAAAEDVSNATRTQRWSDLSYVFAGTAGDYWARNYYLDYPLLFVNTYHAGEPRIAAQGGPVLPYMTEVPMPVSGKYGMYAVGCSSVTTTTLKIGGIDQAVDCSGVDGLSYVFGANTISPTAQTDPATKAYRPRRYVF